MSNNVIILFHNVYNSIILLKTSGEDKGFPIKNGLVTIHILIVLFVKPINPQYGIPHYRLYYMYMLFEGNM